MESTVKHAQSIIITMREKVSVRLLMESTVKHNYGQYDCPNEISVRLLMESTVKHVNSD